MHIRMSEASFGRHNDKGGNVRLITDPVLSARQRRVKFADIHPSNLLKVICRKRRRNENGFPNPERLEIPAETVHIVHVKRRSSTLLRRGSS